MLMNVCVSIRCLGSFLCDLREDMVLYPDAFPSQRSPLDGSVAIGINYLSYRILQVCLAVICSSHDVRCHNFPIMPDDLSQS